MFDSSRPDRLLKACPAYSSTSLERIEIDRRKVWIKDESKRMGLGSFKALGGVYAVLNMVMEAAGTRTTDTPDDLEALKQSGRSMVFVCASAGNHGLSVAAGARVFGAKARIHVAETVPKAFLQRLSQLGAEVIISGATYESSVAAASEDARHTGAILLADTSWEGYEEIPRLVMEGYTVIARELRSAFQTLGDWPTSVFLQAGVGGLAGALASEIRKTWEVQPKILVVEPTAAPCLRDSALAGKRTDVYGPTSNMGRLDCKSASKIAFELLERHADTFLAVDDEDASNAATALTLHGFPTTPSGAAGYAGLMATGSEAGEAPLIIVSEGPE